MITLQISRLFKGSERLRFSFMNKKSILITGSSRGIGRACAKAYAKAGYHVFLNCVHHVERLEELAHEILSDGGSCTAVPGDVSNPDEVRKIFQIIEKECGDSPISDFGH